jgi:hypothetical protein
MSAEYGIWHSLIEMTVSTGRAVPDTSLSMEEESKSVHWRERIGSDRDAGTSIRTAAVAWVVPTVYFVYQYALRSTSPVMMPQLSIPFGLSALGVVLMLVLFYCGYSPFGLVAGAAADRLRPRIMRPVAAAVSLPDLHSATQRLDLGDSDQRGTHDRTAHRVAAWIDLSAPKHRRHIVS